MLAVGGLSIRWRFDEMSAEEGDDAGTRVASRWLVITSPHDSCDHPVEPGKVLVAVVVEEAMSGIGVYLDVVADPGRG